MALKAWSPVVDVYEDENAFVIKVELPEVNQEDVKVSLNENTLSIGGERRVENEQKRENENLTSSPARRITCLPRF